MDEELSGLLRRAMALPPSAREELASSLVNSLPGTTDRKKGSAWFDKQRRMATAGLGRVGRVGFMEACFINQEVVSKTQRELLKTAERATIHAFGWPIGVVLHTEDGRPKPMADGIVAEISGIDSSYDYWALRENGHFFFLGSLFEDERATNVIWFDTRIMRVTETLLFCYRLYKSLGVHDETEISIRIRHGGLRGRVLSSARPAVWASDRSSREDEVEWNKITTISSIRIELRKMVKEALDPLFMVFDFYTPSSEQVTSQVDQFLAKVAQQQQPFEI